VLEEVGKLNWLFDHGAKTRSTWPVVVVCCVAVFLLVSPADASRDLPDSLSPTIAGPVAGPADLERDPQVRPKLPLFSAADIVALSYGYDGPDRLLSLTSGRGSFGRRVFQGLWTDPVTGISYARNRWYDARTASWLSEDPKGAIDSPNLYAFVGWGPHDGRDPMGLHDIVEGEYRGYPANFVRPTGDELAEGQLTMSVTYEPWWWPEPITETISQHQGEMLALQAKVPGNELGRFTFEMYYGTSADSVGMSFWELMAKGAWHHKEEIALSTLAASTMVGRSPKPAPGQSSGTPQMNGAKPNPASPKSAPGNAPAASPSGPSPARYKYEASTGQFRDLQTGRFVSPRDLPWPGNSGFASSTRGTLKPGTVVDRYGPPTGRYAGQPGATASRRGMAPGTEELPYRKYRVVKPVEVETGPAAPVSEFGAEGGATQYMFDEPINELLKQGVLVEVL